MVVSDENGRQGVSEVSGERVEPASDVDLREAPDEDAIHPRHKKFGTFGGVFTPTLLTILGVIMYLREGWVIGNAGILGGALIILLSFTITGLTALSMSSITTNIRIGAGGAYAIVAQSLGLEIGGSLGIPRYLSQALAVTMYIFGFREGWLWVFPHHPALLVDLATFVVLFVIAYKSAGLAIRVQYLIMAVIVASLASIALAAATGSMQHPLSQVGWWGEFPGSPEHGFQGTTFWLVFAVFFPASTGIMAGANMSGDLKNPRRSIPLGTMSAVGVSLVVYLALAYWLARSATPEELVSNYTVAIDKAFWGPAVLAGLLGATFSSALASLVGSARILQAMGDHRVLPGGEWLARRTRLGEPRNAMMVTGLILVVSLMLRDLNAVAPLITMFFLITYAMLNGVLLLEQSLGLISFRPRLRVPTFVPLLGLLGSLGAMFIIHPTIAWVSLAIVLGFYWLLQRRRLEAPFADVRSSLFVALAEWAATKVSEMPIRKERAWKPNLLVPARSAAEVRGIFDLLSDIVAPRGTLKLAGLALEEDAEALASRLEDVAYAFRERGVSATTTVIDASGFADELVAGMQTLRGAVFKPNILFLDMPDEKSRTAEGITRLVTEADHEGIGVLLFARHDLAGLARRESLNVWIRDRSPDWKISWDIGNLDLSILTALKLQANWDARMRLVMGVGSSAEAERARSFLEDLVSMARLPDPEIVVEEGSFDDLVDRAPGADLNLMGMAASPDFDRAREIVRRTRSSCLFVRDSGSESALA